MKVLITLWLGLFLTCSAQAKKVLIVLTSQSQMGESQKQTGFWLSELTHPYYVLKDSGIEVDIASIQGGTAPIDPRSLELSDDTNQRFFNDAEIMRQVLSSRKLGDIKAEEYKAVLFSGGHGTMWDFPNDKNVNRLAREIYESGNVVAAVCHGPAALVGVTLSNGDYLVNGKKVAAFTNKEEVATGLDKDVPFMLETKLKELGAEHISGANWESNVVVDGRLVTGQNPQSATAVGEAIVDLLSKESSEAE